MKRLVVVIGVMLLMFGATSAFAQGLGFGVKGGLNIATLRGDDVEDASSRMALIAGGFLCVPINDMFGLRPEALFSMQGAKMEGEMMGVSWESTTKLNYIQIPVLLSLMIPTEGNIRPSVFAGPAVGLNLSADTEWEGGGESGEEDIKDSTKSVDFGVAFGAGVGVPMGNGTLTVDGRYTMGLTSIDDSDASATKADEDDEIDIKNGVISIMVGYRFK